MKKKHFEKNFEEDVDIKEEEIEHVIIKEEKHDFVGVKEELNEGEIVAWNDFEESLIDTRENHEFDGVKEEVVDINDEEIIAWNDFEGSSNELEENDKKNYMPGANLSGHPSHKPRQNWSKIEMIEAIKKVRANEMSLKGASKAFKVPRTTLRRLAAEKTLSPEDAVHRKLGRKPAIPDEIEKELVEYLLQMENAYHCLTRKDVRKMAYEVAERNNVEHPFNNETAGRAWLDNFLKRHERISLRTSDARAEGFPSTSKMTASPKDILPVANKIVASNRGRKRSAATIISPSHKKHLEEPKKEKAERGRGRGGPKVENPVLSVAEVVLE